MRGSGVATGAAGGHRRLARSETFAGVGAAKRRRRARGAHVASRLDVRAIALSCVLVLAPASPAAAQTEVDADDLLREGVAFAEAGEHTRAVAWLERARAIAPSDRVDVNLAASLVALGELRRAQAILERLSRDATVNPLIAELARERLEALRARMGEVVVSVSPLPDGAWLNVDGRRIGAARETTLLRAFPGTVRLALLARDGTVLARARALVEEGGRTDVTLAPVLVNAANLSARPSPRRGPRRSAEAPAAAPFDPWPWAFGVVAVLLALGAGIGIGAAIWAPMDGGMPGSM